ncbi:unnamed protein product, partial [Didymodactylos carnosus]
LRKLYDAEKFPKILILEKNNRLCSGASGKNGGFLWPNTDSLYDYVDRYGERTGYEMVEFAHNNAVELEKFVNENNIECDLNLKDGNLALARTKDEWLELVYSLDLVKKFVTQYPRSTMKMENFELWDHDKCTANIHSNKFIGGLMMKYSGTLWTAKLVYGIIKLILSMNVHILTNAKVVKVDSIEMVPTISKLSLENGTIIWARNVVHATNAYMTEYINFVRDKIIPTRGQCMITKPLEKSYWTYGMSANNGREYYHQLKDNRIVFGGCTKENASEHKSMDDREINAEVRREHELFFEQWYPNMTTKIEIEQEWAGVMACTVDKLPLVGKLPNSKGRNEFIIGGYNGDGTPNAFLCGKAIARMIANESPFQEGEGKGTVSFVKAYLPDRFLLS